ncbi:hypothetical protein OIK40_09185 [Erythrobacter sp. sf7]|uniref:Response regulatory domain-containing protein n=1 Tax=Erythrobacter fulvus TaxID=2987523 RepID=A0ABT5JTC9_9SPHN|nr:hypothetical protein [Erythrobacter fulvus]MDC8754812.1 hypothetical protein [Erythrobacter fulvus]
MDDRMSMSQTLTLYRRVPTRMCVCVVARQSELDGLEERLPAEFREMVTGIAASADEALPELPSTRPNVLVIEVNPALPGSMRRAEQTRARFPDLPMIAAVENLDLNKVRTLMRLGIKDVVALPFNVDELLPAVIDLGTEQAGTDAGLAPMHAVIHSSGGAGASTVVSHLAAALVDQNEDARCCIVDLDFQFGEMALLFGQTPSTGVLDCLDAGDRLDWDIVAGAVTKVRPRIDLLAAPRDIPPPETIATEQLLRLLTMLRQFYDHVLLDFPVGWSEAGLSAACACDRLLLVVDQSVRSISRAAKTIALLDSVELERQHVGLIVNRAEKRLFQAISTDDVSATLGREIVAAVPLVKSALQEAQVRGVLLSEEDPRGAFAKTFGQLAQNIATETGEAS